jgi:hypothetical protein
MGKDYIPEKDGMAAVWMGAFAAGIAKAPGAYMLSPPDVAIIQQVVAEFQHELPVATAPATRTKGTVHSKNQARARAEALLRLYAQQIKLNRGISDASKLAIGVPPPNTARSRRDVPLSSPVVSVVAATQGAHTLAYKDTITPGRAMPFGAVCLQVFRAISEDGPVRDPADARLCGCFTRSPAVVTFRAEDNRKTATYFARWASRRGEFGNWSMPTSFTIAA